jgi:hypothetical protein
MSEQYALLHDEDGKPLSEFALADRIFMLCHELHRRGGGKKLESIMEAI